MMIMMQQKKLYIGAIPSEEKAARFYDKVAILSHGI